MLGSLTTSPPQYIIGKSSSYYAALPRAAGTRCGAVRMRRRNIPSVPENHCVQNAGTKGNPKDMRSCLTVGIAVGVDPDINVCSGVNDVSPGEVTVRYRSRG